MQWYHADSRFDSYLQDESLKTGFFDLICFPIDAAQLRNAMADCRHAGVSVTVQGARTGIAGGAVPIGGRVISTEKLNGIHMEGNLLTAQCGARLCDIQSAARTAHLFFPPAPTEDSATIGGAFACAASGPNCLRWGDVSRYVERLSVLLADGRQWSIPRGSYIFDCSGCPLPDGGRLNLNSPLPPVGAARWGYAPKAGTDLIDLFCGSEGSLAVIYDLTLRLEPYLDRNWGLLFFFASESDALRFARQLVASRQVIHAEAIEYLDGAALTLISDARAAASRLAELPEFPAHRAAAVYVELCPDGDDSLVQQALANCLTLFTDCNGQEADTWAASGESELARLHLLRHSAVEAVSLRLNQLRQGNPDLVRLCAAYQTPLDHMEQAAAVYRADLDKAGIPGTVFGHASIGRLHVDLLPECTEQVAKAEALLEHWADLVEEWGGHAMAENGAGKNRLGLFLRRVPADQLAVMKELKAFFDPAGLLNPGTIPG